MSLSEKSSSNLHYIFYAIILTIGIWIGYYLSSNNPTQGSAKNETQQQVSKISDIFNYIHDNYVDSVEYDKLVDDALESILLHLDPHSNYIPVEDFEFVNEDMTGKFDGIGIQFRIEKDTVMVIQTIPNGPSEKVGLKAGDRIIEADGKNIAGVQITNNEVMKMLRGAKGTKVEVRVKRTGIKELLTFTITRNEIPTFSVDYSGMITKDIGYIKLSSFKIKSDIEFRDALKKLTDKGLTKLIFDLRGNGGGSLDACIKIADQFFDAGVLLVYTEGLHRSRQDTYSTKQGLFKTGKLVVLVDEFSASASEIIAGAVQDNDRGVIIGRRTFGKGLVQEQIGFRDGSAIRLTVSRYYTPVGRSIQRNYEKGLEAYYDEFYTRVMDEFQTGDDTSSFDTIQYRTPKGKIVYGGGGIQPDIHVGYPLIYKNDSLKMYFNMLFQFSFEYTDKNRQRLLNTYRNADGFIKGFVITPVIWNSYIDFIKKNPADKKQPNPGNLNAEERKFIEIHLKANIGRNLFDYDGYYPIVKDADEILQEAIKSFEQ